MRATVATEAKRAAERASCRHGAAPEYLLRALETDAADRGVTLDHYLYGELIDFAGTASDRLTRRIPGYRQAYLYPGPP